MQVRLTRKYAERIDDVDLSNCHVGDILDLSDRDAYLLIAEGWASPVPEEHHETQQRATAADARPHSRRRRRRT